MKIGGKYKLHDIQKPEWEKFAGQHQLEGDAFILRIRDMARRLPEAAEQVGAEMGDQGIGHDVVQQLIGKITERPGDCFSGLDG